MRESVARGSSRFDSVNRALRFFHMPYALTGSLALEAHLRSCGANTIDRALNDIDVVIASFTGAPASLTRHFLCVHVHPDATGGRTLLQLADPRTRMRIDMFQAVGATMSRTILVRCGELDVRIVSLEDLAARAVRHVLAMERGNPVPRKTADDLLRMLPHVEMSAAEYAWRDHRARASDGSFESAAARATALIECCPQLLSAPVYSTDTSAICNRCRPHGAFRLAPKQDVLAILGYC